MAFCKQATSWHTVADHNMLAPQQSGLLQTTHQAAAKRTVRGHVQHCRVQGALVSVQ
jgi:hypothetical protein